jgi:cytochrome c oxidase assembly protein subunit 15
MSRRGFARGAWAVLGYTIAVIAWGAFVRATGSGAGCGEHWPLCNGVALPRSPSVETAIELTHRVTSGMSLLAVLGLAWWARRALPARHRARTAAALALVFMIGEALIGAGLVLFGLVGTNDSHARAVVMAIHLANTFLLLASLTLAARWATAPPRTGPRLFTPGGWAVLVAYVVVGVSGAVAALGDTLFPATTLGAGLREDLAAGAHLLVRLRLYHPWIAVGVVLAISAWVRRSGRAAAFGSLAVTTLTVQLALGAVNVLLLAPVWLQLVHLVVADLGWVLLVLTADAVSHHSTSRAAIASPIVTSSFPKGPG